MFSSCDINNLFILTSIKDAYGIRVYNIKSGGLYDPSFDMFINYAGGKVLGSVLGNVSNKVISFIGKYTGGLNNG